MAKVYDNATDMITFARSSSGTALRRVGYGDDIYAAKDDYYIVAGNTDGTWSAASGVKSMDWVSVSGGMLYQLDAIGGDANRFRHQFQLSDGSYTTAVFDDKTWTQKHITTPANAVSMRVYYGNNVVEATSIVVRSVIFDRATDDLVLFNHPDDTPRIEYAADGSLKGLLIEEQRTNLLTYSEDFTDTSWAVNGYGTGSAPVVSTSSVTDPAGGTGAYQVELDAGSGTTLGDQSVLGASVTTTQGADYTHSIWVRGDTGGEQINIRGAAQGGYQLITLTTDWLRVTGTEAALSTISPIQVGIRQSANGVINSTATIHVYGAQIEEGSFPTSYIPTSGSTVTRSPDIASIPVSAFGYNQSAGTVVVEATAASQLDGTMVNICDIGSGGSIERMQLRFQVTGIQAIFADGGAANGSSIVNLSLSVGDTATGAWTFSSDNTLTTAANGTVGPTDTSHTVPTPSELRVGRLGTAEFLNGHIKSLSYFPRRLTDAQLQELTS